MTRIIHVALIIMPRISYAPQPQRNDSLTYCTLLAVWRSTLYHAATTCGYFFLFWLKEFVCNISKTIYPTQNPCKCHGLSHIYASCCQQNNHGLPTENQNQNFKDFT